MNNKTEIVLMATFHFHVTFEMIFPLPIMLLLFYYFLYYYYYFFRIYIITRNNSSLFSNSIRFFYNLKFVLGIIIIN